MRNNLLKFLFLFILTITFQSFASDAVINSLSDAKAGEWVLYKLPDSSYVQKQIVTEVVGTGPEASIKLKVENILNNEVVEAKEITLPAGDSIIPNNSKLGNITVNKEPYTLVNNKTVSATVVDITLEDGRNNKLYLSEEIPVFGLIKSISNGSLEYELLDYGY